MPESAPEQWIGLHDAAQRLGVHETTLRRWADTGEIPVMVTPGGHRRFAVSDLDHFADERRRLRVVASIGQVWADRVLAQTRQHIDSHRADQWMSFFNDQERAHKRELGQRLLEILLQYISLKEGGDELLEEARAIGREHSQKSLQVGMSLVETLQIVLFFRDTMFDVALHLPDVAHVKAEANTLLLRRMGRLLSAVELSVAEIFDQAIPREPQTQSGQL